MLIHFEFRPPRADPDGNIALVENGDLITIDTDAGSFDVDLTNEELAGRRANWTPREPWYDGGVIAKYAKLVSSSSIGAITDEN